MSTETSEDVKLRERGVELLNALTGEYTCWQVTEGRKNYRDVFGDLIPAGNIHYKQGAIMTGDEAVRLSFASMANLIRILFVAGNDNFLKFAKAEHEAQMADLVAKMSE